MLQYDDQQVIAALTKRKSTKAIGKQLERLRALLSIQLDLNRVGDTVELINSLSEQRAMAGVEQVSETDSLIDGSLATYALITYARCTDTSSSSRNGFDPRRYLNAEQKAFHEELLNLRNEAVAHFGSGRHADGPWASDRLLIGLEPATGQLGFALEWKRVNHKGRVIAELQSVLLAAREGLATDLKRLEQRLSADFRQSAEAQAILAQLPSIVIDRLNVVRSTNFASRAFSLSEDNLLEEIDLSSDAVGQAQE